MNHHLYAIFILTSPPPSLSFRIYSRYYEYGGASTAHCDAADTRGNIVGIN